ncbi:hypothetical protein DCS_01968 [Drechmeria coniospora]|uniref:Uncharacterized protein n=1 Tax=Drechmeria coniospora TaxID=98403 RepID=A0A151GUS7_DRECN|nr:hypothetical protein DCS_01968 [Drechmeria coniospora]KYK60830.1 hypothetical protein DCS_01968 [Drechmeria coniospora]
MSLRIRIGRIAVGSALFATASAGVYAALVCGQLSATRRRRITSTDHVPESFAKSDAVTRLVNPRGNVAWGDSRSVTLRISSTRGRLLRDEELLARFLKAFFAGSVFAPERIALSLLRPSVGSFPGEPAPCPSSEGCHVHPRPRGLDSPSAPSVWDPAELSDQKPPPPGTVLFGTFQLAAMHLADAEDGPAESTLDVLYGNGQGRFAGCHRFSIWRETAADGDTDLWLRLSCVTCNPTVDRPLRPSFMWWFHKAYAMLLFRDAVGSVQRSL